MISKNKAIARILLSSGATNTEIARQLGVTLETVRTRIYRMMNYFGASNRVELALKILHSEHWLTFVMQTERSKQKRTHWDMPR